MGFILGIDPGVSGALALLTEGGALLSVHDMPVTEAVIGKTKRRRVAPVLLARLMRELAPDTVAIEQVQPMPRRKAKGDAEGGAGGGSGALSAFGLGRSLGVVEGVVAGLALPIVSSHPATWKRAMQLTSDKERSRQRALELWPAQANLFARKKDADRAEAALLGLYMLRVMQRGTVAA